MKAIELKGLDQTLYYEKLENGLEVYMLPYKNKSNYTMHYLTKYGSIQTTFIPYGEKEKITVPDGIAHFLEHKMFEQEDGVDPFTYAAKTGTYSNASTNFECTRYYFEGNQAFQDNLNYLLDFVGSPYFTDENVEKEKGIIAEEIKQYDDEVEWVFEEEMKKALLQKDNHRVDIAGTIESINTITKEDLYNTYYTFYQPSNMFLVISGDFKVEDAINTIKNNETLRNAKTNFKVKVFQEEEPLAVNEKIKELEFNVVNTKVGYGIKIPIKHIKDKYLFNLYIGLMLSIKFGLSSVFREKLKKEQLMTSFYMEREIVGEYLIIVFKADSETPFELIEEIKKELANIEIPEEEINRLKKVWISSEVIMIDNINMSLENIVDDIIEFGDIIPNKVEIFRSLNKKDYDKILSSIDFSNSSTVIIRPKEKE
ncbi:insulinase family protein [bacterium]|nr:insulinase family protein [bacterium]